MSKSKYFFINGDKYFTNSEFTLLDLIHYLNYKTSLLVLEYNSLICNSKNWDKTFIHDNDKIEIVTIVGGG